MTELYRDRARADAAVERLKVYAQSQRLMILSCLLLGERTVSEIDSAARIGQPALSQQLAELRRAGMVQSRKDGKLVFYSLADESTALCVRAMEAILGSDGDPSARLSQLLSEAKPRPTPPSPAAGSAGFVRLASSRGS
ncbi:MAG: ArsR/SmtB family transcription factor [Novosphingobium sp.]